ncbi:glutaredoxin [Synechococcus phage S-CAM22]|uniref:Glutaredoxin n=1 Tax=Synechococcus phage S-CAM22 TaxID=1883365 RepID=A0A1D8KS35_9CAUD|nr:glutaredoxin [Synechococcus phage S-CAM22]AOV61387.1 glutaredoxin [Synechococcus phage S-CAM22]
MKAIIYSNDNMESDRACALMEAVHMDDTIVYKLNKDFTESQFRDEFGEEAEYPMIALGMQHRGTLKETLHFMNTKGMLV